jgi:hypothetical protein
MKKRFAFILSLCVILVMSLSADVLIDESPLKKGKALLFKDNTDPDSFYYLSTEIRVPFGTDNRPKVNFFKLKNQEVALSFFLTHGLSPDEFDRIGKKLAEERPGAILKGPLSFSKGKFYIINRKNGGTELWAEGKAPLFPNQEIVVTKRLKEPFEWDIKAVFVMEYEGITKKINAKLRVDWDEIYVQSAFSQKTSWTSTEIKENLYRLKETGAIQLEVTGDDSDLGAAWKTASEHLIHQIFDVQEIRLTESPASVSFGAGPQTVVYSLKTEKKSGTYQVDFNRRFRDKRQIILITDISDTIKKAIDQ